MARWVGRTLLFEYHEAAWSRRTSGFPIYAAKVDGERVVLRRVGETQKRPFGVTLPDGFGAIIRYYETNSGYPSLTVYFPDGRTVRVNHSNAPELMEDSNAILRAAAWGVELGRWPDWVEKES